MSAKVMIPTPLRRFTENQATVEVEGATVGEVLGRLSEQHSGLRKHLYNEQGTLRNYVNVYLNDEDVRFLERDATPVRGGDVLSIVPSIAGGTS